MIITCLVVVGFVAYDIPYYYITMYTVFDELSTTQILQQYDCLRKLVLGPVHTYPEICENANFFYEYGLRPHVSSVFSGRTRKFLKTLSRVEIFLSDTNTYTCGRSYPQICECAYVIFLDPVFTSSIINKHGVQQGCIFFVN